jgi:hypothetical protein
MQMAMISLATAVVMMCGAAETGAPSAPLNAVPFTAVKVSDAFWAPRITLNREKVLPHNFQYCRSEGKIDNFLKAAGKKEGPHIGAPWEDSDVVKVIEGAAYSLAQQRDPELERTADEVIEAIAGAQEPSGYLHTYHTLLKPDEKWTDDSRHETYCAGHLIEAGIAYYQATGKRRLLDVGIRLADHMYKTFGPGGQTDTSQHEEVELALVKLWRLTNDPRYLELSKLFIERRGHYEGRKVKGGFGETCQDHKPVRDQREIVGHAVRAMYLYSAVTDLAGITGDQGYRTTIDAIWNDVTQKKMYLTGGIGDSSRSNEGFSLPYFLPNDTAYAETCAAVGMALWNQRMALLHADAKYADIVEREIYNGLLSGVSLDGQKFFYCNPLSSRGDAHRKPWQGCSCCPTNIVRFLPTIGSYLYATRGGDVYVNQYVAGEATIQTEAGAVKLAQETRYPWDGAIRIGVTPETPAKFALRLRIPAWRQGVASEDDLYRFQDRAESGAATIEVNGEKIDAPAIEKGYAYLEREWKAGDVVKLDLPMPIRRVYAHPNVEADQGLVALQCGPFVYCYEAVDNDSAVPFLALPADAPLRMEWRDDLLGGVNVIRGTARVRNAEGTIEPFEFTATPYYAWDNRAAGAMRVWLPEDPNRAPQRPKPTVASESHATSSGANADYPEAMNDRVDPQNSADISIPRMTWWDHKGPVEWAQYDFDRPRTVRSVDVYWFDDTGFGSCRTPKSWRLLYKEGDTWKEVLTKSAYPVSKDTYNQVEFAPVATAALRIEAQLQPEFSGGILEWRVEE